MSIEYIPTVYTLEVYEDSFVNDPSYHVSSQTPFSTFNAGDYFDSRVTNNWFDQPDLSIEKFQIQKINHMVFSLGESNNHHKIMLLLKKIPNSND